jgi:hypothetical protein
MPVFRGWEGVGVAGGTELRTTMLQMYTPPPGVVRGGIGKSKCCNARSICVGVICRGEFQRISPGSKGVARFGAGEDSGGEALVAIDAAVDRSDSGNAAGTGAILASDLHLDRDCGSGYCPGGR